jgi:O-antigen/teichoic acid export membrane protein
MGEIDKLKRRNFVKKIIESFFGRISYLVLSLVFSMICTRIYGVSIYGVFTYAFTLVTLLMIPAKVGFDNGLLYSIPKHKNKFVSASFFINLFASILIVLVVGILINDMYIWVALPLIWFLSAEQLFFALFRSEDKIKEYYLINGFTSMIIRVLVVLILYFFFGDSAYNLLIAVYVALIYSIFVYFRKQRKRFEGVSIEWEYIKYSIPLIFATFMQTIINKIDIIMLGNMTTNEEVGIYQITFQISSTIAIFLYVLNTVFAKRISNLYHNNNIERLKSLYKKSTIMIAILALGYLIMLAVFDDFILGLFGEDVSEGKVALLYRNIAQFINVAVGSVWLLLALTGKPKFQLYANIIACILNVMLNLYLIPNYGINGAAIASLVAIAFTNIAGYIIVSKRFKIKVYKLF